MVRLKKTASGTYPVTVGSLSFTFDLFLARRKTIAIRVYPDGRIQVDAPLSASHAAIMAFVIRRSDWIAKHLRTIQATPQRVNVPHHYIDGELYRYLGRNFPLRIVKAAREGVGLSREWLTVCVHNPADPVRVEKLITAWYRQRAAHVFATRLKVCYPQIARWNIPKPPISIRMMKTRWGSCSGKGKVTLNLKLIQAPRGLIDYVLLHELCHLKEFNHSPRFWALMTEILPDWKQRRKLLNGYDFGTI